MKIFAAILLLAAVSCQAEVHSRVTRNAYTDGLTSLLEKFREQARTEDNEWGLPLLEPYSAEHIPIEVNDDIAQVNATLSNLVVNGLTDFVIDHVTFTLIGMRLRLGLTFPTIDLTSKYTFDSLIANVAPIYGAGDVSAEAQNVVVTADLRISTRDGFLFVRALETTFGLEGLDLAITGLLDNEDFSSLISAVASDMAPQLVEDYQTEITTLVNAVLTEVIDGFLSTMSLSDLLGLIGN